MASKPDVKAKVAYVKSQGQTRAHHCHWPGCNSNVPPAMWGCTEHWYALPKYLRDKVWKAFDPGQEVTMTPSTSYINVAHEVQEWITEHYTGPVAIPKSKPDCANCPWADPATKLPRHEPVVGSFPVNPIGVLVGEGPGSEEIEQGKPFVGRTGVWLDDRLTENGLDRHNLVLVNAQGCQPPKGEKTDDTMRAATKACAPLFNSQYAQYKALPTLAMGKWASAAANDGKPITVESGRGFVRGSLLVTWHPTYAAFYNPWKAGEFVNDLQRFKRMLSGKLEPAPTVILRGTVQDFIGIASSTWARQVGLSVDLETRPGAGRPAHEGKDPYRAVIKTIAIGTPDLGIGYWWGSDTKVQNTIIRILEDPRLVKVWHNGWMFDQPIMIRHGVRPVNSRDTRDMRRAVSATSRLSLRFLVSIETDFAPWKETEDDK